MFQKYQEMSKDGSLFCSDRFITFYQVQLNKADFILCENM